MKRYLIVNPGSTSKKYAFYINDERKFHAHLEKEHDKYVAHITIDDRKGKIEINESEFHKPYKHISEILISNKFIKSNDDIDAVGIRIVSPGTFFQKHKDIDDVYLKKLQEAEDIAPLHISTALHEIENVRSGMDKVKLIGVSDTAFHKNKTDVAKYYAINKEDADRLELYRYGYHGISISSLIYKINKDLGRLPAKVVLCHLGGGSSITAIVNGRSIDTSMGFSPLGGLTMATRVGDIDIEVAAILSRKLKMTWEELELYFNKKCGLLGLSNNKSDDIRELLELEKKGDKDAKLALDDYVYQIKRYIGSYFAAMNGIDLLVFSGTVGVRSFPIRARVCKDMENLGIEIDSDKNNKAFESDSFINSNGSKVRILTLNTDEQGEMARIVREHLPT